jgi:hypothetical protein
MLVSRVLRSTLARRPAVWRAARAGWLRAGAAFFALAFLAGKGWLLKGALLASFGSK